MTRDAMDVLSLQRDPTLRVALPEAPLDDGREPNAQSPEQLATLLTAMRTHYLQHYGTVVTLAYTLRTPNSLDRAWVRCLTEAEIKHRFTVHGLRYTFIDLVRRANVDAVVRRALTGHMTEDMQRHYSTVGMDEKRAAIAGVIRLVPPEKKGATVCDGAGGTGGGTNSPEKVTA